MYDAGYEETERLLAALEERISREYRQASEEAQEKLDDYLRRFKIKDELKRKALDAGLITKKDYIEWREQQIMVGKRWEELRDTLANDYSHANDIAKEIMRNSMPEIYAVNRNYGMYQVEKEAGINTSFTLYNRQAVEQLMRDNPQILPDPGKKVSSRIAKGLDVRWNRQQIQSVMLQSLLLGEPISKIAHRLAYIVGDSNHKAAIRNARTMTTGTQNAGRLDSFKHMQGIGVKMQQEWNAVHDGRTRHSHRAIDKEVQEVGHKFSNGCRYPGDPTGPPSEVWNCRCRLESVIEGLEKRARKYQDPLIEGMTYDEWKNAKPRSNPIDLPEKKGEAIKRSYQKEYKKYAGLDETDAVKHGKIDSGETISMINQRNTGKGNPNAILTFGVDLNKRQSALLERLAHTDDKITVPKKNVNMKDLAALTASTGDEFALFTKGKERMVMRGHSRGVNIDVEQAKELAEQGYKWSGHTHPSIEPNALISSKGDRLVLEQFTQKRSVIYNPKAQFAIFEKGD